MKRHRQPNKLDRYIDEKATKQENLAWPNYQVNSRGIDEFLLNGSSNPTVVQRIAAWLIGLTLISIGFGFLAIAGTVEHNERVAWTVAGGLWALGGWNCYNGSRRRQSALKTK